MLSTFFLGLPVPLSSFLMIVISCMTDVYGGVALTLEEGEDEAMEKPPRDFKKTHLVDWKLIAYGYLFIGNLESVACFFIWFVYMAQRGPTNQLQGPIPANYDGPPLTFPLGYRADQLIFAWNWGSSALGELGEDNRRASIEASSVFFVTATVCQLSHLLSIRVKQPYFYGGLASFKLPPLSILVAIVLSILTVVFFTEVPAVQVSCGTASVPIQWWGVSIGLSACVFFLGECRKWVIYSFPNSWMAATAF